MTDFNQAIVLGNLTRDPELRYTPNGQAVASFAVATNRSWVDGSSGEKKDSVEYHEVVTWGKLAEICGQLLSKGRKVYIEGRLQTRSWEGQDGVKRQKTEIVAENMLVLDKPKEWSQGGAAPMSAPQNDMMPPVNSAPMGDVPMGGGEVSLDDIPF